MKVEFLGVIDQYEYCQIVSTKGYFSVKSDSISAVSKALSLGGVEKGVVPFITAEISPKARIYELEDVIAILKDQ